MNNYAPSPYASQDPITNDAHPYNPDLRQISRTPSPTPSEIQALNQKGFVNWKSVFDRNQMWTKNRISPSPPHRFATFHSSLHVAVTYICILILAVLGGLFIFYHDQIVLAIQPAANWMHGCVLPNPQRHSLTVTFQHQVRVANSNSYFLRHLIPTGQHIIPIFYHVLSY